MRYVMLVLGMLILAGCASTRTFDRRISSSLHVVAENLSDDPVNVMLYCDGRTLPVLRQVTLGRTERRSYSIGPMGCGTLRVRIEPMFGWGEPFQEVFHGVVGCSVLQIRAARHLPTSFVMPLGIEGCQR